MNLKINILTKERVTNLDFFYFIIKFQKSQKKNSFNGSG